MKVLILNDADSVAGDDIDHNLAVIREANVVILYREYDQTYEVVKDGTPHDVTVEVLK